MLQVPVLHTADHIQPRKTTFTRLLMHGIMKIGSHISQVKSRPATRDEGHANTDACSPIHHLLSSRQLQTISGAQRQKDGLHLHTSDYGEPLVHRVSVMGRKNDNHSLNREIVNLVSAVHWPDLMSCLHCKLDFGNGEGSLTFCDVALRLRASTGPQNVHQYTLTLWLVRFSWGDNFCC